MKKSILSLIAGAIVALASCSQADEMPGQPQEGGQLATFTIQTPAATRADVTSQLSRFIVEAYKGSSATGTLAARVEAATGTLVVELEKNTEYTFLFWADKGTAKAGSTASSGYWDTADLKAVEVASGKESATSEAAYCLATTLNTANLTSGYAVELRNATAQMNFVEKTGVSGDNNTLIVSYATGATLNVGTGEVAEGSTFAARTFTNIGPASAGATLATDYILAPKGEQRLLNVAIKFNNEELKTLTNVPFQQCYKTNITGEYAPTIPPTTGDFTFTITADDTWENPDKDYDFTETGWDGTYPTSVDEAKQWLGTEVEGENDTDGKNHVFEISTAKQLVAMHYLIKENATLNTTLNKSYSFPTYRLKADINLNNHSWTPTGVTSGFTICFSGVFDGQGHTISGVNVSESTYRNFGFFGINRGTFKHLTVKGQVEYTGTGGKSIGGIAGENYGTIAFCSFEGTVSATNANATEEISLGWICGKNISGASDNDAGQIISCFAKGTISGAASSVVKMGGMTGINKYLTEYSGIVSGCTWYYKSGATPEGIEKCYSGWTAGGSDTNASYSTDTELANRVDVMNQNTANYDYQWAPNVNTLKLVLKSAPH